MILYPTVHVSMEPDTMREFMAWWDTMCPFPLGMDNDDDEEDMVASLEGYLDEDPQQVENPMHNIPMQGAVGPIPSLVALVEVVPLVETSNTLVHLLLLWRLVYKVKKIEKE